MIDVRENKDQFIYTGKLVSLSYKVHSLNFDAVAVSQ